MNFKGRQNKLNAALAEARLDALVITHLPNITYLCGFTGSAGVLVAQPSRWAFFTDGRYTEQAHAEVQGARVVIGWKSALAMAGASLGKLGARARVGVEAEHMTVATRGALQAAAPKGARLKSTSGVVERLRMVKEPEEIERLRVAVLTGSAVLDTAVEAIRPGRSETAVAAELEYAARGAGAEGMSFPTIVASGVRSALPHGVASAARISPSGFVVLDYGVILAGYCSDMTRTVHVGRPTREMRGVYEAVRAAQQAGIKAVRAGVEARAVDRAARRVLAQAGLGRYFTHSTGHGVGLEVHEPPRVARGSTQVLEAGMVITIEPGAYLPGKGGVRIEDMVVVTDDGCEVLTPSPKDLLVR